MKIDQDLRGRLFIVAAPSGAGKTSLVSRLVADVENVEVSVSHTTRDKRPAEVDGVDYFFVNEQQFKTMQANHSFLECAEVFGSFYGTSFDQIDARRSQGIDIVLDIDWQGAQNIKRLCPDAVGIFILPPSHETLKQRLHDRQQDHVDVIETRMKQAWSELTHYHEFDYMIVNEDFEKAAFELQSIVVAERLRRDQQIIRHQKLLSLLLTAQ